MAGCAGLYTDGFDRQQYILIIENTRRLADQDLAPRLFAAKDPLFLFIIEAAGSLSDDSQLVFLIVAVLAAMTKVIATSVIPGRRALFMALYAIFIAPGLEFAAIRAGLAMGLTMFGYLAIRRWRWKVWWVALGLASHMSVLVVSFGRIWARYWRATLVGLLVLAAVFSPTLLALLEDDLRYSHYLENRGTLFALGPPMVNLLCLLLLSGSLNARIPERHLLLTDDWVLTSYFIAGASLLVAIPFVTASTRLMELSWVLLLLQLIARDGEVRGKAHALRISSWCTWIALASSTNLARDTWAILI